VFFYFSKLLFSGFLQFEGNFVRGQTDTKYRNWAPVSRVTKIDV